MLRDPTANSFEDSWDTKLKLKCGTKARDVILILKCFVRELFIKHGNFIGILNIWFSQCYYFSCQLYHDVVFVCCVAQNVWKCYHTFISDMTLEVSEPNIVGFSLHHPDYVVIPISLSANYYLSMISSSRYIFKL